jgi:hypothetical protein
MSAYPQRPNDNADILVSSRDTGLAERAERAVQLVDIRIDNFVVTVAVDTAGRFEGVTRIVAAGDFLTPLQRVAAAGYHDVDAYYSDDNA